MSLPCCLTRDTLTLSLAIWLEASLPQWMLAPLHLPFPLADLIDVTAQANTAAVDLEVFVASV